MKVDQGLSHIFVKLMTPSLVCVQFKNESGVHLFFVMGVALNNLEIINPHWP